MKKKKLLKYLQYWVDQETKAQETYYKGNDELRKDSEIVKDVLNMLIDDIEEGNYK